MYSKFLSFRGLKTWAKETRGYGEVGGEGGGGLWRGGWGGGRGGGLTDIPARKEFESLKGW